MTEPAPAYGLWFLVLLNSAVFIIFAFSFARPETPRDWRAFGAFSAFIVALFTEMYGVPLTIYLISGWLQTRYPGLDLLSHEAGHLWLTMFGVKGDPHFGPLHLISGLVIGGGFILLSAAWNVLHRAQRHHRLATTGVYGRIRHPQYVGFILIMLGFLLQWPTILTLVMFPLLVVMYVRLAKAEEREAARVFGAEYFAYEAAVPGWFPRLNNRRPGVGRAERMQVAPPRVRPAASLAIGQSASYLAGRSWSRAAQTRAVPGSLLFPRRMT